MATKNATIRLPEDISEWLTADGKSINQAVVDCALFLRKIRQVSLNEIKGVFSSEEWSFLADSLNGTWMDENFRCSAKALVIHCEDSASLDSLDKKWSVDMEAFTKKILNLRGANIDAIYTRVEDFWNHEEKYDLEEWANF